MSSADFSPSSREALPWGNASFGEGQAAGGAEAEAGHRIERPKEPDSLRALFSEHRTIPNADVVVAKARYEEFVRELFGDYEALEEWVLEGLSTEGESGKELVALISYSFDLGTGGGAYTAAAEVNGIGLNPYSAEEIVEYEEKVATLEGALDLDSEEDLNLFVALDQRLRQFFYVRKVLRRKFPLSERLPSVEGVTDAETSPTPKQAFTRALFDGTLPKALLLKSPAAAPEEDPLFQQILSWLVDDESPEMYRTALELWDTHNSWPETQLKQRVQGFVPTPDNPVESHLEDWIYKGDRDALHVGRLLQLRTILHP